MRQWLLLASLLLSDLSAPGDGDWITDDFRWPLCRKLLLLRMKVPCKGLRILQTAGFRGDHKSRRMGSAFYRASEPPKAQDRTLWENLGIILRNPTSAPVWFFIWLNVIRVCSPVGAFLFHWLCAAAAPCIAAPMISIPGEVATDYRAAKHHTRDTSTRMGEDDSYSPTDFTRIKRK